jgi:hypothetical protein
VRSTPAAFFSPAVGASALLTARRWPIACAIFITARGLPLVTRLSQRLPAHVRDLVGEQRVEHLGGLEIARFRPGLDQLAEEIHLAGFEGAVLERDASSSDSIRQTTPHS